MLVAVACGMASAQAPHPKPAANKTATKKANELTLAGLRPGQDTLAKAIRLNGKPISPQRDPDGSSWEDICKWRTLTIDADRSGKIQTLRLNQHNQQVVAQCLEVKHDSWRTGRGLSLGDPPERVVELYGEPDSRSPSTKDQQSLELMYYAFDWAGADVPQVMEVVCTKEENGHPPRVVEITLAAPSL